MIVNTVRNILQGFGASSIQGGTNSVTGAPSTQVITVSVNFAAGKAGINVGYAKVRVSGMPGGFIEGVTLTAGGAGPQPIIFGMAARPVDPAPNPGWEGSFVFPFVLDYQQTSFSAAVMFDATTTAATVDFEVWGNAMAGGQ